MVSFARPIAGLVVAVTFLLGLPAPAAEQNAKIVFLAGPKDHGKPGRHEYEKDLRVLAACLEDSSNLTGVTTRVVVGAAPRDLEVFRDAAAIVIESSSDRWERETHPLFPPGPMTNHRGYDEETTAWLKSLDELIKERKIGVVILHYTNWAENWAARGYYVSWTGGLWVQMISRNPVDQWAMSLESPDHPVLCGVQPWTYRGEIFYRFHLPGDAPYNLASPDDHQRRTSLATVKVWIDAAAHLGSTAVRVNPGNGPIEHSIASLKEVNAYAQSRGLPLLTENHFGIEMNPDVHLRIREEAGPDNVYTLPDFGNYSDAARFPALEKILPYAWLISAKAVDFDANLEHVSYDFDACVRLAEKSGFKGVYSVEQWSRQEQNLDYEKVGDWLLAHVRANI